MKKTSTILKIAQDAITIARKVRNLEAELDGYKEDLRAYAQEKLEGTDETKFELETEEGTVSVVLVRDRPTLRKGANLTALRETIGDVTFNHLFAEKTVVSFSSEFEAALEAHVSKAEKKAIEAVVELVPCEPRVTIPK